MYKLDVQCMLYLNVPYNCCREHIARVGYREKVVQLRDMVSSKSCFDVRTVSFTYMYVSVPLAHLAQFLSDIQILSKIRCSLKYSCVVNHLSVICMELNILNVWKTDDYL